ncbi:MAG: sporulation protein YqfD [Oscillospiraceae bacterium]
MFDEIRFQVTGGLYNDFFNYLMESGYIVLHICHTTFGFSAICRGKDYLKISKAAKKFQCRTKVIERNGLYFKISKYIKRKGLIVGIGCFLALSYLFTLIIWRIEINTEDANLKNSIVSLLYSQEIYTGSVYSKEALQKATRYIYLQNEDIAFISLNFSKGVLTCHVDKSVKKEDYLSTATNSDIIATQDGVITQLRVYSGFSLVGLKQAVAKGDILVSATTLTANNHTAIANPRAYVEAYCEKTYSVSVPLNKNQPVYTGEILQQKSIKFMGKIYIYRDVDISQWSCYTSSVKINYCSFFGFKLPVTQEVKSYCRLKNSDIKLSGEKAFSAAKNQIYTIIRQDISLIKEEKRSYTKYESDEEVRVDCTVCGYYDITR